MRFRDSFKQMDPRKIKIETGFNVRDYSLDENKAYLATLKASIKISGVLKEIWVRYEAADESYYLVDGECRLRSTMELIAEGIPIEEVPVKILDAGNEIERKLLSLTANSGKPLTKWEAGQGYKQLIGWGWQVETIAARVCATERYVREAVELANAPQQVKEMLSTGAVTPRLALKAVRQSGSKAVEVLAEKIEIAHAEGKTTAKAERTTAEAEFAKITRAIYNNCSVDYEDNEKRRNTDDFYQHVPVDVDLLKRLFRLVGIEDRKAA
jgi:ParB-like chromosome segregation protein Spo0J